MLACVLKGVLSFEQGDWFLGLVGIVLACVGERMYSRVCLVTFGSLLVLGWHVRERMLVFTYVFIAAFSSIYVFLHYLQSLPIWPLFFLSIIITHSLTPHRLTIALSPLTVTYFPPSHILSLSPHCLIVAFTIAISPVSLSPLSPFG